MTKPQRGKKKMQDKKEVWWSVCWGEPFDGGVLTRGGGAGAERRGNREERRGAEGGGEKVWENTRKEREWRKRRPGT